MVAMDNETRFTFILPPLLRAKILSEAKDAGRSAGDIVRRALEEHFANAAGKQRRRPT
ncbi:hypothetical protein M0R72_13400 [Candidatus Pacearchaeota archaeon]|jgi:negative regulator of replication initiation|nr:hypothetical protein [Candidatus Pacearchaeota archaeon]